MTDQRILKSIAHRNDVELHRLGNPMLRARRRIFWMALLLSLGYLGFYALRGDETIYQARPVSQPHQLFQHDCQQCHRENFQSFRTLVSEGDYHRHVEQITCGKCHPQTAWDHQGVDASGQPRMVESDIFRCSECHREHTDAMDLTRSDDRFCVRCHADLKTPQGSSIHFARQIIDFASHPEFALLRTIDSAPSHQHSDVHGIHQVASWLEDGDASRWLDNSSIKFPHDVHLDPNRTLIPSTHPEADQRRGMSKQLVCLDCHEVADDGRYMQPIQYEKHCRSCHPIAVSAKISDLPHVAPNLVEGLIRQQLFENFDGIETTSEVPPRMPSKRIREEIRDRWQRMEEAWLLKDGAPGHTKRDSTVGNQKQQLGETETDAIRPQFTLAERVKMVCAYCHLTTAPSASRQGANLAFEIQPTNIPDRWMTHAKFRHDKHDIGSMECRECHAAAESHDATDVIMPSVKKCQECHRRTGHVSLRSGARHDCVECHGYHNHTVPKTEHAE